MKRSMGLDIGTRTIGVATSDLLGMIAGGVETIRRTTEERDFERIGELIKEHEVDTVVLGYPKNMNGTIGERAHVSEAFAEELKKRFEGIKVVLWDERLSTVAAENVLIDADLKRKNALGALLYDLLDAEPIIDRIPYNGNMDDWLNQMLQALPAELEDISPEQKERAMLLILHEHKDRFPADKRLFLDFVEFAQEGGKLV